MLSAIKTAIISNRPITGVRLLLYRVGDPGVITVSLRKTDGTLPVGSDLVTATSTGGTLTLDTAGVWRAFSFNSSYPTVPTEKIAVVVRCVGVGDLYWKRNSAGDYAGVSRIGSNDAGATWAEVSAQDYCFRLIQDGHIFHEFTTNDGAVNFSGDAWQAQTVYPIISSY